MTDNLAEYKEVKVEVDQYTVAYTMKVMRK